MWVALSTVLAMQIEMVAATFDVDDLALASVPLQITTRMLDPTCPDIRARPRSAACA